MYEKGVSQSSVHRLGRLDRPPLEAESTYVYIPIEGTLDDEDEGYEAPKRRLQAVNSRVKCPWCRTRCGLFDNRPDDDSATLQCKATCTDCGCNARYTYNDWPTPSKTLGPRPTPWEVGAGGEMGAGAARVGKRRVGVESG